MRTTDSDQQMIHEGLVFCVNCGDHFGTMQELSKHCATNEYCQTKENEKYLAKYLPTGSQSDEETRYACAFCEKYFPWVSSLTRHVSKDHNNKPKKLSKEKSVKQKKFENYAVLEPSIVISEEKDNQTYVVTNGFGGIPQNKDNIIIKSQESETSKEYLLPHGWKKIGQQRKNPNANKRKWDFLVQSPDGKKLRTNSALNEYLKQNPGVKCDLNVTNTNYPEGLDMNWSLLRNGKLPLPPDISDDPLSIIS